MHSMPWSRRKRRKSSKPVSQIAWQVIECLPIKCNRAIRRGGGWRDVVRKSGRSERGPT